MTYKPTSGISVTAMRKKMHPEDQAADLSTQQRKNLSRSQFVFPAKAPGPGSYPIPDRTHAANALARAAGKPEYAAVKRAVCSRYSDLPACKGD